MKSKNWGNREKQVRQTSGGARDPQGARALPATVLLGSQRPRRQTSFWEARSPAARASVLAMAMGGGGGGGVPELEESVLFRRGTGQVRSRGSASRQAPGAGS